jgi:hypothetical protein
MQLKHATWVEGRHLLAGRHAASARSIGCFVNVVLTPQRGARCGTPPNARTHGLPRGFDDGTRAASCQVPRAEERGKHGEGAEKVGS